MTSQKVWRNDVEVATGGFYTCQIDTATQPQTPTVEYAQVGEPAPTLVDLAKHKQVCKLGHRLIKKLYSKSEALNEAQEELSDINWVMRMFFRTLALWR